MATNITAEWEGTKPDGSGAMASKASISLNDVVVNTTVTAVGTFNTATVTADVARTHALTQAAHGVPDGVYEATGATVGGQKVFRRKVNVIPG